MVDTAFHIAQPCYIMLGAIFFATPVFVKDRRVRRRIVLAGAAAALMVSLALIVVTFIALIVGTTTS